jgi:polysaccharide deacetylase family protein (PEP-CTERM system associated)
MTSGPLILSMDVEDWPQSTWDRSLPITTRSLRNTEQVLDLLNARHVRITMFVLGKLAEAFPSLVRRMAAEGHEIASHGYGHIEIFTQTRDEFREDVRRSKQLLEDIIGERVVGFRAPDFSIVESSLWALDVLAEEGFEYDSSIFPIVHNRYGIPEWPASPARVQLASGRSLVELPIATRRFGTRRLPVGGGGYHRLLPRAAIVWIVAGVVNAGMPFMAYCHPYEFDPDEFRESELPIPWRTRLHQGLGRRGFRRKFVRLTERFNVSLARTVARGTSWPMHSVR